MFDKIIKNILKCSNEVKDRTDFQNKLFEHMYERIYRRKSEINLKK